MKMICSMSLKNRRLRALDRVIYGMLWNMEKEGNTVDKQSDKLKQCIELCKMTRKENSQIFFENKIEENTAKNKR